MVASNFMSMYIQTNMVNVEIQLLHFRVAHYGICLTEFVGFPTSVVHHARIIAARIDAKVAFYLSGWTNLFPIED